MLLIKLFAKAREIVGRPTIEFAWEDGQSVLTLKRCLAEQYPDLVPLLPRLLVAINNDYAADDATVRSSDDVACFPPVSGG